LKTNKFLKDIIKLSSSTIFVQIFSILTIPILTRLYSPETFGDFALIMSILGPLGVIVGLGFEPAIMVAKNDNEAKSLFHLSLLATFVYTLFLLFILIISYFIFDVKFPVAIIIFIPIIVLFGGLSNSLRYWNLRKNNIHTISLATILPPITDRITTLFCGFVGLVHTSSLILGVCLDAFLRPLLLLLGLKKNTNFIFFNIPNRAQLYYYFKKHIKFPLFVLPTNLFMRLTGDIPVYMLTYFFSSSIVGFYSLGLRILNLPLSLIGKSIGEVYFQRNSNAVENFDILLEIIFRKLVSISFLPFIFLGLAGKDLIIYFLGSEWSEAGVYIQLFSLYFFIRFIFCIFDYLVIIKNKQQYSLISNLLLAILTVAAIFIGGYFKNIFFAIFLISLTNSITYLYFSIMVYKECNLSLNKIVTIIFEEFQKLILPISLFLFIRYVIKLNFLFQFIFIIISFILYKKNLIKSLIKK
jgi:lipopolysaccharide exporter